MIVFGIIIFYDDCKLSLIFLEGHHHFVKSWQNLILAVLYVGTQEPIFWLVQLLYRLEKRLGNRLC